MEEKGEAHQLQYGVTQDEGGGPPLHQPQGKEGKEGRGGLQPGILQQGHKKTSAAPPSLGTEQSL